MDLVEHETEQCLSDDHISHKIAAGVGRKKGVLLKIWCSSHVNLSTFTLGMLRELTTSLEFRQDL